MERNSVSLSANVGFFLDTVLMRDDLLCCSTTTPLQHKRSQSKKTHVSPFASYTWVGSGDLYEFCGALAHFRGVSAVTLCRRPPRRQAVHFLLFLPTVRGVGAGVGANDGTGVGTGVGAGAAVNVGAGVGTGVGEGVVEVVQILQDFRQDCCIKVGLRLHSFVFAQ